MVNNFFVRLLYVVILWIFMDVFLIFKYLWCKKKCSGKKCRNWMCKHYNTCSFHHVQLNSIQILNAAGYELVIGEDKIASLPDYIPDESFPVDFVRKESSLHFNNKDEMFVWSGMIYKHYIEFINK